VRIARDKLITDSIIAFQAGKLSGNTEEKEDMWPLLSPPWSS
jgi:hypothetical protein